MDKTIQATKVNSITTPTIWGGLMQTCTFAHCKIPGIKYISMNERLEILQDVKLAEGEYAHLKAWYIGDQGHYQRIDATDGETYLDAAKHKPVHAACFRPRPFALRPEGQDLTPQEQEKYCSRRLETLDGVRYWAYYGMWIKDLDQKTPKVYLTTVTDGVEDTKEYITSNGNLYPTHEVIPPDGSITTDSSVVTVSLTHNITFTPKDVQEYMNVARILFKGNEKRAIVSEIALATGGEKVISTTTDGGAPINFKEIVQSWIAAFVSTYQPLVFNTNGFTMELELGVTEPMLTGTEVPTPEVMDALNAARRTRLSATLYTNNGE